MSDANGSTAITSIQPSEYIKNNWVLVPIEPDTKGPRHKGWNMFDRCVSTVEQVNGHEGGWGLAHAYSGTCAIDIDDWDRSVALFCGYGLDLFELCNAPDAVLIKGRPGRAKLLYTLPPGVDPLRSKSIAKPGADGKPIMVIEFRCATASGATVQDVIPPSVHPFTGHPYEWAGQGDWRNPPVLPEALLEVWQSLITKKEPSNRTAPVEVDHGELTSALYHLDPDELDYDSWLEVMMAVNATGEDWAGDLFMEWSSQSGRDVPRTTAYKWRSLNPDGDITPATLFKRARDAGWRYRPDKSPEDMFGKVDEGMFLDESDAPVEKVETYMYLRDMHLFIHTGRNRFMKVEQLNCMYPMERTTWSRNFFEGAMKPSVNFANGVTYLPNGPRVYNGDYNIWQPPTNKPIEGNVAPWLALLERLVPVPEERLHLLQWMGFTVQHPDQKINHAILMVSENQGVGKDSLFEPLLHAIGTHNCEMIFASTLQQPYNSFLKNSKLMIVQEIMDWHKGEMEHYLKPMLASPPTYLEIREKYTKYYSIPNICQFILFSNELAAIRVAKSDRRYFCVKSDAEPLGDQAEALWSWYHAGGFEKVAYYLHQVDLSGFSPTEAPPMTTFKSDLIESSRAEIDIAIEEYMEEHFEMQVFTSRQLQARLGGDKTLKQIGVALKRLGYMTHRTSKKRFWSRPGVSDEIVELFKKDEMG